MKKISSPKDKPSPFLRLMKRGHRKTDYKAENGKLLMAFSEEDHKRIATLIGRWLDKDPIDKSD